METCTNWTRIYCDELSWFECRIPRYCYHFDANKVLQRNVLRFKSSGSLTTDMLKGFYQISVAQFTFCWTWTTQIFCNIKCSQLVEKPKICMLESPISAVINVYTVLAWTYLAVSSRLGTFDCCLCRNLVLSLSCNEDRTICIYYWEIWIMVQRRTELSSSHFWSGEGIHHLKRIFEQKVGMMRWRAMTMQILIYGHQEQDQIMDHPEQRKIPLGPSQSEGFPSNRN